MAIDLTIDCCGTERREVYLKIADITRRQMVDVAKSGWGFWGRRCAILNLEGIADLCDTYAESEGMGIDTVVEESRL